MNIKISNEKAQSIKIIVQKLAPLTINTTSHEYQVDNTKHHKAGAILLSETVGSKQTVLQSSKNLLNVFFCTDLRGMP